MNKFSVTYEIGEENNPSTICTRFVKAEDADMAVVKVLAEKDSDGDALSCYIMLRITKVERV